MNSDPLAPHRHDPNPEPPSEDSTIVLTDPDGRTQTITINYLQKFPTQILNDCYIVSTGHGTSGPFTFSGTPLHTLISALSPGMSTFDQVEIISGDGFGTRVGRTELIDQPKQARPILLALQRDGRTLTRQEGAVRLIVPSETDDALRQVKWIRQINLVRSG